MATGKGGGGTEVGVGGGGCSINIRRKEDVARRTCLCTGGGPVNPTLRFRIIMVSGIAVRNQAAVRMNRIKKNFGFTFTDHKVW